MLNNKDKKKRRLWPVALVLILLAVLFVFGILIGKGVFSEGKEPTITSDIIANGIADISEYTVLEYRYTNVGKFEDQIDFYGWMVPLTTKSFIITYDGSMKLGVSGTADIQINGKKVNVTLSPVMVLSHVIDENSIEVLDQTKNVFNQIEVEDYTNFAADQKKVMEEKAVISGFFNEAEEIAKDRFTSFIQALPGMEGYEVTVEIGKR